MAISSYGKNKTCTNRKPNVYDLSGFTHIKPQRGYGAGNRQLISIQIVPIRMLGAFFETYSFRYDNYHTFRSFYCYVSKQQRQESALFEGFERQDNWFAQLRTLRNQKNIAKKMTKNCFHFGQALCVASEILSGGRDRTELLENWGQCVFATLGIIEEPVTSSDGCHLTISG